jgi:dienelactone hydrolase
MSKLASVVFLSSALWTGIAAAQAVEQFSVPVDYQGGQIQLKADLQKPATRAGPFPAVIALHGCDGYDDPLSISAWLALLWQQGYATLRLDSFTARGHYRGICSSLGEVAEFQRATDALAAAYVLAGRPDVRRDRIAVIGWAHGGGGAARVTKDGPDWRPAREKLASRGGKVVAGVDLYGGCGDPAYRVVAPLLVLVGALDEFNPGGGGCLELAKANPSLVTVQVYPGAYHLFDDPIKIQNYRGHMLGYNAEATADARIRVTEFLRRCMQ